MDQRGERMAKIPKYYVRPDGLHESILRIDGKRKAFRGKTDTEVWEKVKAYHAQASDRTRATQLFSTVADDWWTETEPTLERNTLRGYKPAIARAIEQFGHRLVCDITAQEINLYIKQFSMGMAKKTTITQLQIIRQILRKAELDGLITYNPATAVSIPKNLKQQRRQAPSKEDISKIKECVHQPFGLFAFLIYYTGCRRGEALGLKYCDIDFTRNEVHINRTIFHEGQVGEIKEPKTASGCRTVPLLDALKQELHRGTGSGYIFSNDDGKSPMRYAAMQNAIKRYHKETGVDATPHQIRHGYATALFESGIEPKTAQTLLGHSQLSTTMDIYTHVCGHKFKEAAEKMNGGF